MFDGEPAMQYQKRSTRIASITAALAAAALSSLAPPCAIAQEIPVPIQKLAFLEGTWSGDATIAADGQTITFRLNFIVTKIAGGLGYYAVGSADIPGMGAYTESDMFGYDAGKDLVHMFSVTATGETHDHTGRFDRNGNITFKYEGVMNGKRYLETIPMTIMSPTEFRFKSTVTIGGKVMSTFQATMRKG